MKAELSALEATSVNTRRVYLYLFWSLFPQSVVLYTTNSIICLFCVCFMRPLTLRQKVKHRKCLSLNILQLSGSLQRKSEAPPINIAPSSTLAPFCPGPRVAWTQNQWWLPWSICINYGCVRKLLFSFLNSAGTQNRHHVKYTVAFSTGLLKNDLFR